MRVGCLLLVLGLAGCESSTTVTTTLAPSPIASPQAASVPVTSCQIGTCATTPTCPVGYTCSPGGGTPGTFLAPQQRMPEIAQFTSDSYRVGRWDGVGTVLRWEVSDPQANVRIDPYPGNVGAVGFVVVFPALTTTYTLTARNNIGTVQRQLTIIVLD